jgi:hypothetical protein
MKRALAGILTVVIVSVMIATALRPKTPSYPVGRMRAEQAGHIAAPASDAQFQDASRRVEGLLDCARRGDVSAYLEAFAGPLRGRLEQEAKERGLAAFAGQLQRAGGARKSHAIFAPRSEGTGSSAVTVTVESVYADRIERQTFRLTRDSGAWLVTEVERARDVRTGKPLGTIATFEEPEGVPVGEPWK